MMDLEWGVPQRTDAADAHLLVVFYMGTLRNEERSLAEGRHVVDDIECVKIMVPGDKNNTLDRPVTPNDKRRFPVQYAAFKAGKEGEDQISGTRLQDWPFLSRGQVEELKFIGIKTVEQLANVADSVNYPGIQQFKAHAKSWLATAKDSALAAQQAERLERQDSEIASLKQALEEQAAQITKLQQGRRG